MKSVTIEPHGLVLSPNQIGQYPDGACSVATGVVFTGAGKCASAPAFDAKWSIDAGATVLRAVVIPTDKHTLVLLQTAPGWSHCWIDDAGAVSPIETASNAYTARVAYEIDGRVDYTIARDRVFVTSTTGPVVFDYIAPTSAAERAPRLAGMFSPALHANPVYGAGKSAIKQGYHAHCVMTVSRHFPDCYEVIGAPSAAHQVIAASGDCNVQMQVLQRPGHPQLLAGDRVEVWRTLSVRAPTLTPQYDQGISTEPVYFLSSTFVVPDPPSAFFHQWEEATGDQNLGESLYTNTAVVGASSQKRPPPIARAICDYRNYTFYADVTESATTTHRVGAGLGTLPDTYSQTWGVGTRPGPVYDTVEINGTSKRQANADDLAANDKINVDDLARVNPDSQSTMSIPATGFAFRFDYAAAGDFTIRASNGANYQPPLPTLAQTPETITRPRRPHGFAWTEEGQPEAVTQYGIAGNGTIYALAATSSIMLIFTSRGLYRLNGTGGSTSRGFDWSLELIDAQVQLRGPNALCRLGDYVYAATNNGVLAIDGSGQAREISTSALGTIGVKRTFSSTDRTCLVADDVTGDVYCSFDGDSPAVPYVYSSRWNKWSRVRVAPDAATAVVGSSSLRSGMFWLATTGNTLTAYAKSTTAYQQCVVRFQPHFADDPTVLKRWTLAEWYFSGKAFTAPITLIVGKIASITRTLREHDGATSPTYVQSGLAAGVQGDPTTFSLAVTSTDIPRGAPAVSNSLSLGYAAPGGSVEYEFFGVAMVHADSASTVRSRKG